MICVKFCINVLIPSQYKPAGDMLGLIKEEREYILKEFHEFSKCLLAGVREVSQDRISGVFDQGDHDVRLNKQEFVKLGVLSWDTEFNSLT